MRATGGGGLARGSGHQPERIGLTREAYPAQTTLAAVERSMNPVYRRAPHNELSLEQMYYISDRKAWAKAAYARLTPGAQAPMRPAGSFGQDPTAEAGGVCGVISARLP
jgi:hypothetical protein